MSQEKEILLLSIFSLIVNALLIPVFMLPTNSVFLEKIAVLFCLITSVVFYSFAVTKIRKIKKNANPIVSVSILFLILSSLYYIGVFYSVVEACFIFLNK